MKNGIFALDAVILYLLLHYEWCESYAVKTRHDDGRCEIKKSSCPYEVTCFENDETPDSENFVLNGNYTNFFPYSLNNYVQINLIYKFNGDNPNALYERLQSTNIFREIIRILDLSENQLYDQPNNICPMYNLEKINLSHNNLSNALFYNTDELPSLKEIDFSNNIITTMEVSEYEYEYVFKELKIINLSYNNILIIPDFIFNSFNDLQYLDLSNNRISDIMSNTFEGISSLKYLNVSFNNINDINTSLFRFRNLIELNLSNNKISKIVRHNFDNLNELQFLDLSSNVILTVDNDGFKHLYRLKNINLSANNLQRIGSNLFTESICLDQINLSYNNITQIPKNMFLKKNITMFSIQGNNITGALERGLFEGLDSITELDLNHQSVTSIGDYSFFGLIRLTKLLLNNNKIYFLALKSFITLKSLTILDMSNNRITSLDFDKSDLLNLKSLELSNNLIKEINVDHLFYLHRLQYLDLSQNNVTRLVPQSFQSLSSLDNFLLSENPLTGTLEEKTFDGLFGVPLLDLSGTSLNLIRNNTFDGMMHLYDLNISRSKIAEIQYNSFSNIDNIEIIDLSFNRLEIFAVNTSHLKSLKDLRLNNNNIKTLSQSFVKGLSQLYKIVLSHNKLLTLNSDTFQDQKFLIYLDLSYNLNFNLDFSLIRYANRLNTLILSGTLSNMTLKEMKDMPLTRLDISNSNIHNITFLSLQKVKSIEILLLSNNNITQINFGAFSNLSSVTEIDISYNDIKSIEPGVFTDCRQLHTLNISHNSLSVIRYGIFKGLGHLNVLDISYNNIINLETARLHDLRMLSELLVDHNRINEISVGDLRETKIQKLSIGDNPLPCESLVELIKYSGPVLHVTSIRNTESKDENHIGIACNYHKHIPNQRIVGSEKIKNNDSISENLLLDIRDILLNISSKNQSNDKTMINNKYDFEKSSQLLTDNLKQLNNISRSIEKDYRNTNQYLERLLKLVAAMNSFRPEVSTIQETSKIDVNKNEVDKLKVDIDNNIIIEREKLLAAVSDKLLVINQRIDSLIYSTTLAPVSEHRTFFKEAKSSVLIEICVVLILVILVCFVLYKVYKSRCYIVNRWPTSTRRISDMENSNL